MLHETLSDATECTKCVGADRWYWRKHRWIKANAVAYGADIERAFVVYALLSTNASVAGNDKNYVKWLKGEPIGHFGDVLRRIELASNGKLAEALTYKSGRKIVSFRENLRFPWRLDGAVTIDRHAADIVTGDRRLSKNWLARKDGYENLVHLYRKTARAVGKRPHELQARVWVHHVECGKAAV